MRLRDGDLEDDLEWVVQAHHDLYVATGDYDAVFAGYVQRSVQPFVDLFDPGRDRLWIAEDGQRVGAIAIQHSTDRSDWAQLRWFFVLPDGRRQGLGSRLLQSALAWCRDVGYHGIYLWTMEGLDGARRLYEDAGFRLQETAPAPWHPRLLQQRFELAL